jgi:uncharacterized C2H2 Zn-finger protein
MLSLPDAPALVDAAPASGDMESALRCVECARVFKLPMHWARHRSAKHRSDVA